MAQFNEKMVGWGQSRSVIREIFEYGLKRKAQIGAENVFDFSLGNPSVPAPDCVNDSIRNLLDNCDPVALHGYTSGPGDMAIRKKIAESINRRFGRSLTAGNIYMTVGAAASLTVTLNAIVVPGDEIIALAPFFPEYRVFSEAAGAKLTVVKCREPAFEVDPDDLAAAINEHTKGVIVNSPNNPSGVVLKRENLALVCDVLRAAEKKYGHPVYLIADEPYRELVYGDIEVPYLMNLYDDTVVCYSYSKSLSIPGERIGYIAVCEKAADGERLFAAICGSGRALGYVCASSMFQRVIAECEGKTSDVSVYMKNRDLLFDSLSSYGFECVHPDGAFYLFMKSPEKDANAFAEKAKKYELLIVPSDSFGVEGYVRISYCVATDMIERALPAFEKLAKEYGLGGNAK